MIIKELGDYLERLGIGVMQSTLFLSCIPETAPDNCVVLYEYGGAPSLKSSSGTVAEIARVQVVVRDTSYESGRSIAEQVYQKWDGTGEIILNAVRYMYIEALSPPFLLRRDESNRCLFACNYEVIKERSEV